MTRKEINFLIAWKNKTNRKPLILNGARQVGKTWLLKEFGKKHFENFVYINCESSEVLKSVFASTFDIDRILTAIQIETGIKPEPKKTLIILDEIQQAKGALTSLKYFQENADEYYVVAAGSLLGLSLSSGSFPVGKVDFLNIYPLSFLEFLEALEEIPLVENIKAKNWDLLKIFKQKLQGLIQQYYFVGGMPEAVQSFVDTKDFGLVREIQNRILTSYEFDFAKHAPAALVPRIRLLWQSIPSQLAKENRKFIYKAVKEGARAKDYENAIAWLLDAGLVMKVNCVTKASLPLKAYEDFSAFKLFGLDIGLLNAMANVSMLAISDENNNLGEFKGVMAEQYVLQELRTNFKSEIYYWSADNARAEIDFLIENNSEIVPIEVKSSENLHAKSLRVFNEKFSPKVCIRFSMSDFRDDDWLLNYPLWAVSCL